MRPSAHYLIASLGRNVASGFRLGLFLPVSRDAFRVGADHFAMLAAFNLLVWIAGGALRLGFTGNFNAGAIPVMLATITVVLLVSLVVAHLLRDPSLLVAFAVMLSSTDLLFEIAGSLFYAGFDGGWIPEVPAARIGIFGAYVLWVAASAVRAQLLLMPWRSFGSSRAAAVLVAVVLAFAYVPRDEPWVAVKDDDENLPAEILIEDRYHLQGAMLARELARLAPQRPGVEDLYFLGVAPYASQDTFARELAKVKTFMDDSFDTRERSIALINNPATITEAPIATATSLRTALAQFGEIMDPEEDVLFLFITTHGTQDHQLSFQWPPLRLQQVNPTSLARMLADSGIKWKVIVLSACYSGGFIEALRDPNTAIVTAADATHASFGCEATSEFTWFSRAMFDEAMRDEARQGRFSLTAAFERARSSIAVREKAAGFEPSNPQMVVGEAIAGKLKALEARLAARPKTNVPAGTIVPGVQASM